MLHGDLKSVFLELGLLLGLRVCVYYLFVSVCVCGRQPNSGKDWRARCCSNQQQPAYTRRLSRLTYCSQFLPTTHLSLSIVNESSLSYKRIARQNVLATMLPPFQSHLNELQHVYSPRYSLLTMKYLQIGRAHV